MPISISNFVNRIIHALDAREFEPTAIFKSCCLKLKENSVTESG